MRRLLVKIGAWLAILLGLGYFATTLSAFCFGLLAVAAAYTLRLPPLE